MRKLWTIAWKEITTRFTDRNLLVIMIAAPLAIATVVGLAFGGLGRDTSPITHIPVAVINRDQAGRLGVNFGDILGSLLISGQLPATVEADTADCSALESGAPATSAAPATSLGELMDGTAFDAATAERLLAEGSIEQPASPPGTDGYIEEAARSAVDHGVYTALILIPPDFSASLSGLADPSQPTSGAVVQVYANRGRALAGVIVRSVVDGITSQLVSGNVAIGATIGELAAVRPEALGGLAQVDFTRLFGCAFMPEADLVTLESLPVEASAEASPASSLLVRIGSAQAMFFALFTGQFGILSMYEERKNWTLQRMIASPTPRWAILGGKLVGVMASVLFQLLALAVSLTLIGSLLAGGLILIWGSDLGRLGLLLLAVATAVGGLGMLLAGVLKGVEQASIVASVLNMALGVLGGAFSFQLPASISALSFIYWGREAFQSLASGHGDILLHLVVLFGQGVVMFAVGLFLFNRRFEV
jgi:ABC-2 type transport system permease protein